MFTIRIGGIEVECGNVTDAAALIAALGERGAARLLPTAVAEPKADTRVGPPAPRRVQAVQSLAKKPAPGHKGRAPTWSPDELKALSARLRNGERLDVLAAEKGKRPVALYQSLRRAGLPAKYVAAAVPAIRKLAPGASGLEDEKGSYRKIG